MQQTPIGSLAAALQRSIPELTQVVGNDPHNVRKQSRQVQLIFSDTKCCGDSAFYRVPALSTVKDWYAKAPPGFLFAAKVPQVTTHEKVLREWDEDLSNFFKTMDCLGQARGIGTWFA